MMDPNHFLMIVLSRFELYQIFSTPDYGKRFSSEVTHKVRACVTKPRCPVCMKDSSACGLTSELDPPPAGRCSAEQHSDRRDALPHHHACR